MPHVEALHADDPGRVGRYRLSGRIVGIPGTGPVYLAKTIDGSDVTITLLDGDWTADPAERDRFTAEASAASRVAPFCAARILGSGFEGKQAFLVSEYVPGPSLSELVAEQGPWQGRDLQALAIGTATGLAAVHQAGLVHGDFGPQYVVLGPGGPRIIEFAITPPYGSATPSADMRAWVRTVLFAAVGGPSDAPHEDLELLPEPLRSLATQCLTGIPGGPPSAREVVVGLLGSRDPEAGVLGEGSRRAAAAAAAPAGPAEGPVQPGRGGRTRRGATIWWAAGVAACIVAIAAAIHIAESNTGQSSSQSDVAKPANPTPKPRPSPAKRPGSAVAVPVSMAGTWSGQARQDSSSGAFSVTVQVTLASGATRGSVRYSGPFLCTDNLAAVSDARGKLTLDQGIVKGPCQAGVVTLSPDSSTTLRFSFRGKGAPAATGTLTKTS
jgi:eukaryotic-like serine/threonine-protein kinase